MLQYRHRISETHTLYMQHMYILMIFNCCPLPISYSHYVINKLSENMNRSFNNTIVYWINIELVHNEGLYNVYYVRGVYNILLFYIFSTLYVSRYLLLYELVIERICRARHYIVLTGRMALNLHQILFDVRINR